MFKLANSGLINRSFKKNVYWEILRMGFPVGNGDVVPKIHH